MGSNYINEWEGMTGINWNEWIERKDRQKGSSLRSKVVVTAGSNALGECTHCFNDEISAYLNLKTSFTLKQN